MAVLLRRTKGSKIGGQPIIALPERRQQLLKIEFSRDESAFYKQVKGWQGFSRVLDVCLSGVFCRERGRGINTVSPAKT
jgi:hypothetical protein